MKNAAWEIAELKRRMDNMVRLGTIVEVNYKAEPPVARVKYGESESGWIAFMADRANGQEVSWDAPEVGERVIVLALSGDPANARILPGALYCEDHPAPAINPDVITRMHKDGAHDTYDRKARVRTIQLPEDGELKMIIGATILSMTKDAVTLTSPSIIFNADEFVANAKVYNGGKDGALPVARKGDLINTTTKKIEKGSDNVFSK